MPDNLLISRLLQDIIQATNRSLQDEEAERLFSQTISSYFGIDKVTINSMNKVNGRENEVYGYILNTKKSYVDNQLSEYSSFPELIGYKNRGYKSCALVPVVVSGKVVSIMEMLSSAENKFSNELVSGAEFGAYLTGLAMLYKYENERSVRLANYFDGAFNGADAQLLVSQDGKILKANKQARLGILTPKNSTSKIDDIIGMGFAKLQEVAKHGSATATIDIGGQQKLYLITANSVSDNVLHVSCKDVTDIRLLSLVLDSMDADSSICVLYLDDKYVVKSATDSIKRLIGYDKSLVFGKSLVELAIERKKGELKEILDKQTEKARGHGTVDLATARGMPAHLNYVLSKWSDGYMMLLSDATSEGYTEGVRNAFSDFINNTSDAVITMDESGYIKDCNAAAERVLGYERSALVGKEMRSMYSDPSVFDKDITYVRNGGKVDNSYAMFTGKDGGTIDSTETVRLFKSSDVADYIIVIKELETKRRMEEMEELLEREQNRVNRLRSTGDLKSQFIYNISHELKTPLTNIKGFAKLMYSGEFGGLNGEQLNYLGTIIEESDRLMLIIQQVLDAAKLESDKMKLEYREVDLRELENNATMEAMKEDARSKGMSLKWQCGFGVTTITADPNRLIQALVNLIGNSIKFNDKKDGQILVKISPLGKAFVKFDVIDNGIGISEDDKKKLFKKFYEAPKKGLVKQTASGTGLGLSITREIVRLHGGKITCDSVLGKGSTFTFTIRVKPRPKKNADQT
jgi:PAS domain S-box-containing protein